MFQIVVPTYRSRWIGRCLHSLRTQTHSNFRCVVIDDGSGDETLSTALAGARQDPRFVVLSNEERRGALANIIKGIEVLSPEPNDVVAAVDGDDWLLPQALEAVSWAYRGGARLTYGQILCYSSDRVGHCRPYEPEVLEARSYRTHPSWYVSQLRTFRYELWSKIRQEDLLDPKTKKPWEMTWDLAFMLPMMEMCSGEEITCIEEVIYVYNDDHGRNDWKVSQQRRPHGVERQFTMQERIRAMSPYPLRPR